MSSSLSPIEKALWFVEYRTAQQVSLAEMAAVAGLSRSHLSRAFAAATGRPLMAYLRGRRLTVAARALADGAPDILSVALASGYGSHEAFTRAFVELFGITPEALRAAGTLDQLELVEPIKMSKRDFVALEAPRFVTAREMTIAGLGGRFDGESYRAIPGLWERFNLYDGSIPGQAGPAGYGVCYDCADDGSFAYLAGVEVTRSDELPEGFDTVKVPARRYAVFAHRGHVSGIRRTFHTIFSKWLPESGLKAADAPEFERYGPEFDGRTGTGPVEIWIPLEG